MVRAPQKESHIVVVDSQPRDYHELASLAGEQKWHLHFLTTARAMVTFLRRARADLWMINACLPDMSGFALYGILRDQIPGARALIISDQYDLEHERLACRSGVDLYLAKGPAQGLDCQSILRLLVTKNSRENSDHLVGELLDSIGQ